MCENFDDMNILEDPLDPGSHKKKKMHQQYTRNQVCLKRKIVESEINHATFI